MNFSPLIKLDARTKGENPIRLELGFKYILDISNLDYKKINAFAQSWNPGAKWVKYNPMISKNRFSDQHHENTTFNKR